MSFITAYRTATPSQSTLPGLSNVPAWTWALKLVILVGHQNNQLIQDFTKWFNLLRYRFEVICKYMDVSTKF